MVSKICRWDGGVCRRVSCDIILPSGEVILCEYHRNGCGRLTPHKVRVDVGVTLEEYCRKKISYDEFSRRLAGLRSRGGLK